MNATISLTMTMCDVSGDIVIDETTVVVVLHCDEYLNDESYW